MEFNFRDRIIYSASDSLDRTEKVISGIRDVVSDSRLKSLLTRNDIAEIDEALETLEEHSHSNIKIAVVGSFKRGKSMLINAILGENVAPTNVTPETITVNHIGYRETNGTEAVLTNGMRLTLNDEEITRERLESIINDVPAPIDHLEMYRNLPILKEISFVDTPGLDEVGKESKEVVINAIHDADIIIYVVSSASPLSMDEQMFLNSVVYPENFLKMFVIVNMADLLDTPEDLERVKEHVAKAIYEANPQAEVFALSALDEVCKKGGHDRPKPEMSQCLEEHFTAFSNSLTQDVILQKEMIKASRLYTMEARTIDLTISKIEKIIAMSDMDKEKLDAAEKQLLEDKLDLDRKLKSTTETVTRFIDDKRMEAHTWISEFLERMKKELIKAEDDTKGQDIRKHISFYISDKTKEAFTLCIRTHAEELNEKLKDEIENANSAIIGDDKYLGALVRLNDISWTKVDAAVYFGEVISVNLFGNSLGNMFGLLFDAGAGALRQHEVAKSRKEIIAPIVEKFDEVSNQIYNQLDETYNSYAKDCVNEIREYYKKSIDDSLETINQAKAQSESFSEKRDSIHDDMSMFVSSLKELKNEL